ncbi:unnamed protein product [Cryptosporidium hominis]|uniref:WD40-repeat containing protein n=2 Tax=Cryptosporidium hominis TaxID=237895 RepID=A0A0S4TL43_CRYHO|nr:WD repeat-containing protein 82 [Cryptosporidium hominis]PPA64479.1 hypothetical protein ChUKH1_07280 [Cryptosporidium hominis]PPS98116.1 WD40-repeat containing protein [Cryptosporidium hominis]CUV07948.1 unnamed protein product [Cryptosporidium hominis]|eukprot:PPS98116.1 WD40-repeat containing protein [Cryptosporidium hominis]
MLEQSRTVLNDDLITKFKACRVFKDAITPISNMDWSEDGDSLLICESDTLRVYTISSGDIFRIHHSRKNSMDAIKFAHSNKQCLVASNKTDGDATIRLWDIQENRYIRATKLSSGVVPYNGISVHPNKDLFIVSTNDSKVSIYNFKLETPLAVQSTKNKTPISAFDPEGRTFAVATDDHIITMYDSKTYSPFDTFNLSSHIGKKNYIDHITFSPDGRLILVKTNLGKIFTISSFRGELFQEYKTVNKSPNHIIKSETRPVFSSDSQYVIHGLQDSTISIWSTTTAKHIVNLTGHVGQPKCIAFNPKKAFFASGMFIHHLKYI